MTRHKPSNSSSVKLAATIRHVVVAGLGNIGSLAADLIARLGIRQITLCDQGCYESKDIAGQAIDTAAAGRPKVAVVAERLKRIDPGLVVRPIHAKLQDVPLGWLRGADACLCAFDTRGARAYANQLVRHLGIPIFMDAGVEPSQMLARANVHRSDSSCSCFVCGWSDQDYELIEARNPCQVEDAAPSTNAPAALGALAASLLAIELKKAIDGDFEHLATGRQITVCALTHRSFTTEIALNGQCRCDHDPWRIASLKQSPARFTLGEALRLGQALSVPGKAFIGALVCRDCGARRKTLRLAGRLTRRQLTCARCGAGMVAPGFDQLGRLDLASLGNDSKWLGSPLARLGIVEGDIVRIHAAKGDRHYEIGPETKPTEVRHA
jgi:molybdopterin/thiamine biosynthesis adenylyltransferase